MLLFEIQSASTSYDKPISEIYEGVYNNKVAYKAAISLAKSYANEGLYAAVIVHDKTNYNKSAFNCFYATPYEKRYASAHKDGCGFYITNWRKGY